MPTSSIRQHMPAAASSTVNASAPRDPPGPRAPLDHASLLIALALVADVVAGEHRLAPWLAAPVYLAAVALVAWSRSRLVEPLAIAGVVLPLALGDLTARSIAAAGVQAAILATVMVVRRRTRSYYDAPGHGPGWHLSRVRWRRRRRAQTHCRRWRRCSVPR